MSTRTYYRLFLIVGLIAIAGVLGGFIGVYIVFSVLETYGAWPFILIGAAFFTIVIILYIHELRREKKTKTAPEPEIPE